MRRIICSAALFLVCLANVQAQSLDVVTDDKGRKGFADASGKVVIKCKYDDVTPFNEDGVSVVRKGESVGMINMRGKEIVNIGYSEISEFYNGVARISTGKKWGLVSSDGTFVLKPEYDYISQFNSNGLAWIAKDLKEKNGVMESALFGLLDYHGRELAEPVYSALYYAVPRSLSEPVAAGTAMTYNDIKGRHEGLNVISSPDDVIWQGSEYIMFTLPKNTNAPGLMRNDGAVIFSPPEKMTGAVSYPVEGMYVAWTFDPKKRFLTQYYGAVDGSRKIKFREEKFKKTPKNLNKCIWPATSFMGNVAYIGKVPGKMSGRYFIPDEETGYFINKKGKTVVEDIKTYGSPSEGKIVMTNTKGEYGVLDIAGYMMVDFGKYRRVYDYHNGFAAVVAADGGCGYLDADGRLKVKPTYSDVKVKMNSWHYVIAKKSANPCTWGTASLDGKELVPFVYQNIFSVDKKTVGVQKSDSLYYFYDLPNKKIISDGYKAVYMLNVTKDSTAVLKNGLAVVSPATAERKRDVIVVNRDGDVLFPECMDIDYKDLMLQSVEDNGGKPVSKGISHAIVVKATCRTRLYDLSGIVPEEDWDF